jgi:hemerythrin-like domain-containing protein
MPDVFEVLGEDHAEVKYMLTVLEETPGRSAGAAADVLDARKQLAEQLVIESSRHEAAEEQHFWPAVRERLGDGDRLADEAISQESEAKEVLAKIDKLEASDPEFDQLIGEFIPAARRHIEFEETRVWPGLRQALSEAQAQELGEKLQKAKDHGPTRPHPRTPANPALLKAAGPAVAAADKLRDAATGRGRSS